MDESRAHTGYLVRGNGRTDPHGRTLTFSSLYRPMVGHLAAPQLQ